MTLRPPRPVLAITAAALALAGAGCGGDEEYVEAANEVCRDSEAKIREAGADKAKLFAAGDEFIADLKAVDVPDDKRSDYDAWVKTQEGFFQEFKAAVESGDPKQVEALDDSTGDDQARELDLDGCTG